MARKKKKSHFRKQTLRLKDNHTWDAPKGYKIVVLDRGAVSFNIPKKWIVAETEPFTLHDKEPPDDNARLTVSFWQTRPGIDWSGLPLYELFIKSTSNLGENSEHEIIEHGEIITMPRDDLELIWTYHRFIDPVEKREAFSRIAMARGWNVHLLLTLDIWVDDEKKFSPVWDEALRSLQLGRYIEDPTKGEVLH